MQLGQPVQSQPEVWESHLHAHCWHHCPSCHFLRYHSSDSHQTKFQRVHGQQLQQLSFHITALCIYIIDYIIFLFCGKTNWRHQAIHMRFRSSSSDQLLLCIQYQCKVESQIANEYLHVMQGSSMQRGTMKLTGGPPTHRSACVCQDPPSNGDCQTSIVSGQLITKGNQNCNCTQ